MAAVAASEGQRFVKDPNTGKRQARPNPEEEWVIQETPELRILDDDLWNAVKARQEKNKIARKESALNKSERLDIV